MDIPKEWDVPLAHKLWGNHALKKQRPDGIGNLHFSGSPSPNWSVYESHSIMTNPKHKKGWGLANYYLNLPWNYARYILTSMIKHENQNQQNHGTHSDENSDYDSEDHHDSDGGSGSGGGYNIIITYNDIY